ncbi:uncharacterized protein DFL_002575 [Arthrobotrys flagrans]|uniref:Uncharacterized protein n=1 Tax=Arthrobotrys flagrans TaxID=97331 RepID=A0A437AB95_ARTFL|nr:hypothetical protein DFL_002575 [Arthrobotrys flagrans]
MWRPKGIGGRRVAKMFDVISGFVTLSSFVDLGNCERSNQRLERSTTHKSHGTGLETRLESSYNAIGTLFSLISLVCYSIELLRNRIFE